MLCGHYLLECSFRDLQRVVEIQMPGGLGSVTPNLEILILDFLKLIVCS